MKLIDRFASCGFVALSLLLVKVENKIKSDDTMQIMYVSVELIKVTIDISL